MGVEEVANVMEKPAGTVKTLLFRARERLRTLLKTMEKMS
jgi:DNA-directed RNA polymerase specialized sigma24 family protein